MSENKLKVKEYQGYITQFFYTYDSLEKYNMKILEKDSGFFFMYKQNSDSSIIILEEIIRYKDEKCKDKQIQNIRFITQMEDLINKNELAELINTQLVLGEDGYKTKHPYVQSLIYKANIENKMILKEIEQLMNSNILNIISSFEILIGNIYRHFMNYVHRDPKFLEKSLTLGELSLLNSTEEARNFIVDRFVTDKMYAPFNVWIENFIKEGTKINLKEFKKSNQDKLHKMTETFERRNIIVHNNGIVNHKYLSKVNSTLKKDLELGKTIKTDIDYLKERMDIFLEIGLILMANNLEKSQLKSNMNLLNTINEIGLKLLKSGKHHIAKTLYETLMEISEVENNQIFKFNYWLSYKLTDSIEEVEDEIVEYEKSFGGKPDRDSELAITILVHNQKESVEAAIKYISNLDPAYKIEVIDNWPMFLPIKKEKEFIDYVNSIIFSKK